MQNYFEQQRCQKRELWTNSMVTTVTQNCFVFFFPPSIGRLYLDCFYCIDWETLDILNQRPPELLCILNALSNIRNGNPLQYSCLENSMDRGAWWAMVHGVAESWIRLSAHISSCYIASSPLNEGRGSWSL